MAKTPLLKVSKQSFTSPLFFLLNSLVPSEPAKLLKEINVEIIIYINNLLLGSIITQIFGSN